MFICFVGRSKCRLFWAKLVGYVRSRKAKQKLIRLTKFRSNLAFAVWSALLLHFHINQEPKLHPEVNVLPMFCNLQVSLKHMCISVWKALIVLIVTFINKPYIVLENALLLRVILFAILLRGLLWKHLTDWEICDMYFSYKQMEEYKVKLYI